MVNLYYYFGIEKYSFVPFFEKDSFDITDDYQIRETENFDDDTEAVDDETTEAEEKSVASAELKQIADDYVSIAEEYLAFAKKYNKTTAQLCLRYVLLDALHLPDRPCWP